MSNIPAGWYGEGSGRQRWWDGEKWTDAVVDAQASTQEPPRSSDQARVATAPAPAKPKLGPSTFILGALTLVCTVVGFQNSGFGGAVTGLSFVVLLTAVYALVTKRPSWMRIPSRNSAGFIAGLSIVALLVGTMLGDPAENPGAASMVSHQPAPVAEKPGSQIEEPEDAAPLDPVAVPIAEDDAEVSVPDASVTAVPAIDLLNSLETKGRAPKTGYDRASKFGTPWTDVDRNGCDTRNDILKRDLSAAKLSGPCKVMTGTLADKYSGKTISFVRGNTTSTLVQIDHVVALSDAWQEGAQALTQQQRITFANDPLNLMAVDGPTNSSKGDGDAATWLPKNQAFRCEYVSRQISVKATYRLWVTEAEKRAMSRVLSSCPEQEAFTSVFAPEPPPAPAPAPAPVPAPVPDPAPAPEPLSDPGPVNTYYENCTAAREARAAPVYQGGPGYGRHLDRDGDGIGCE